MNKLDLARRLARRSHRSQGQAADDVDTLVYRILKDLKETEGKSPKERKEALVLPAAGSKGKQ